MMGHLIQRSKSTISFKVATAEFPDEAGSLPLYTRVLSIEVKMTPLNIFPYRGEAVI